MPIELDRTFGEYTEPQEEGDENLWLEYFGIGRGRLTWADIHKRRVSVVLGEAGIGKTVEFELETSRLAASGSAFFVALNQLQTSQDWETALGDALERYERWRSSAEVGYFQLDSVDEARLQSPTDLVRALSIVREALKSNLGRVRIAISSRVTDWTVAGVQEAVRKYLLNPINLAVAHQGTPRVKVQSDRDYEETEAEEKEAERPLGARLREFTARRPMTATAAKQPFDMAQAPRNPRDIMNMDRLSTANSADPLTKILLCRITG